MALPGQLPAGSGVTVPGTFSAGAVPPIACDARRLPFCGARQTFFVAMTKYLLLLALGILAWWAWRGFRKSAGTGAQHGGEVERMVQCAHCGVNQPVSESLLANGRYYCCTAHLRESGSDGG
jgi:uncharacterized protein